MPFHPFPHAIGLDIGDRTLKIAQIAKSGAPLSGEYKLNFYGSAALPPNTIEKGEILKAEAALTALRGLVSRAKEKGATGWVVASLPENRTYFRYLPYTADTPPTEAVVKELAERHLPLDPAEAYIDFEYIPAHPDTNESGLMIAAIEKRIADSFTYFLEIAGLSPIAFELESIAVARALIATQPKETTEALILLDIGATRTGMVVYDHQAVQLSEAMTFSGEALTGLFAETFKLDLIEAEKKKCADGIVFTGQDKIKGAHILKQCTTFANEVANFITYYQENFSYAHNVGRILLCGGAGNTAGLDQFLSSRLKLPVVAGNPWESMFSHAKAPLAPAALNGYATALGLALRAAYNPLQKDDRI